MWIEIAIGADFFVFYSSRLARALWIEIGRYVSIDYGTQSRLARALWIEISSRMCQHCTDIVEARESLVD